MRPKALVITINYKGCTATLQFLRTLTAVQSFADIHVIVVENGSHDDSATILRESVSHFKNVELMESPTNRGYFGAARWAFLQYLSRGGLTDWVIVCNNDIVFTELDFFSKLFEKDSDGVGIIAPAIIAELTNVDCNPFLRKRPSSWQIRRYQFWFSHYYLMKVKQWLSPFVRRMRSKVYRNCETVQVIYAPHGAFIIFSKLFFEAGGFIEEMFLYAEEFCVAELCLRLNLIIIHDPDLKIYHEAHRTTGRKLTRSIFAYQQQGFSYALNKYLLCKIIR